jgi:hypothetical protein
MFPEFPDIPAIAAKDTKYRIGSCDRVKLPVDGLEQRRFSAAVRPYDGDRNTMTLSTVSRDSETTIAI